MIGIKRSLWRTAAYFIAVVLMLLPAAEVLAEGETPVITVSSPSDFAALSKNCVYDSYSRGMQVTLLNDIDMSGIDFEPMKIFCGTFEGGGHHITGLKLEFDGSQKGMCFELGESGEIRNLNLSADIKAASSSDGAASIDEIIGSVARNAGINTNISDESGVEVLGGLVGRNSGRIINCSFDGSIKGECVVGGIAGRNESTGYIESCLNAGSVTGIRDTGGIAGSNYGWIKSCKSTGGVNYSPVEDCHNIGGICGVNAGIAENCSNDGQVGYKNVGINIGGIVGNQGGCLSECVNNGTVSGAKSIGGIFGRFEPYTDIRVEDLDRVKDDINELRENVKSDINSTLSSAASDVDGLRERLNTDVNDLLDRFGGGGLLYGLSGVSLSLAEAIDRASVSNSEVMAALRDRINNGGGLSDSARELKDDFGELTDSGAALLDTLNGEAQTSIRDAVGSIDRAVETADSVGGTLDSLLGEMNTLTENINYDYENGDWNSLTDNFNKLDERLDYIQDEVVDPLSVSMNDALRSLANAAAAVRSDSGYIADAIAGPLYEAQELLEGVNNRIDEFNTRINNMRTEIREAIKRVKDMVSGVVVTPKPGGLIGRLFKEKLFMDVYAEEQLTLGEDSLRDELDSITSVDLNLPRTVAGMECDNALVMHCVNMGTIEGQKSLGGIGGTIGIESAVRYGNNLTLKSGGIITPSSVVKAVVNGCLSEGEIKTREGYGGGIVGDAIFGIIKNSVTESNVSCEEGSYIGGIVGFSGGKVIRCAAISDLSGKSYVGGIAGSGNTIAKCYALPRIEKATEKSGAVAGTADGVVLDNYFIKEGLSGIDGADYEGKAVALEPGEITGDGVLPERMTGFDEANWYMGSGGPFLPQNRVLSDNAAANIGALIRSKSAEYASFRFKVKFVIDGNTVYEDIVDYGTVLDKSVIPEPEFRDGYCPGWNHDVSAPIVRNTVFEAEYADAVRTLASAEDPPLLLVEGNFPEGSEVTAREVDIDDTFPRGYKAVAAYEFKITPDYIGTMRVHIRDREEKGNYIGIVADGKTRILKAERDGSYLVFETPQEGSFTVLYRPSSIWLIAAIVLAALGALLLICAAVYRKHKLL